MAFKATHNKDESLPQFMKSPQLKFSHNCGKNGGRVSPINSSLLFGLYPDGLFTFGLHPFGLHCHLDCIHFDYFALRNMFSDNRP